MPIKRVVIIGAGFGGLEAALRLDAKYVQIVLIDRVNHHLFQPLLYQVATAALSPSDVATATRTITRGHRIQVKMANVTGIDVVEKKVMFGGESSECYDYLIIATGSAYSFFGHPEWGRHTLLLKSLSDALAIRDHLLRRFEEADCSNAEDEIRRLLTFVIVGGGPTGVELSGTIAELVRSVMPRDFAAIDRGSARVILCEAGSRLLSSFSEGQSAYATKALDELGVDVRLNAGVEAISHQRVRVGKVEINAATVIWCAGTRARPAAEWLGAKATNNGAVRVGGNCSVPGFPEIFAVGDVASFEDRSGGPLPALASVAKQQGRYVADLLNARLAGRREPVDFRYRDWGALAVIGRSRAVATFGRVRLTGLAAWLTWALVHLALLIDFRSRVLVYVNWMWAWLNHNRGVRLKTGARREADGNGS
jgi:NADH dehydrogenase